MHQLWYTDGPASASLVEQLLAAGANGVRFTFSYDKPLHNLVRAKTIKEIARKCNKECLVIADLAGEKFRLGDFESIVACRKADRFTFTLGGQFRPEFDDEPARIPVRDSRLVELLQEGVELIVGDGSAVLRCLKHESGGVLMEAVSDGTLAPNRGLTIAGSSFSPMSLTDKDKADLEAILSHPYFDSVALSFVDDPQDVKFVKSAASKKGRSITVVAKIETASGLDRCGEVARVADVLLAARGDLALFLPWTELPMAVESIASAARAQGLPWILATQIAEGLERFSMLTRAEICDLSRWVSEGCAGVLLSYETAFGRLPVEAVLATSQLIKRWSRL